MHNRAILNREKKRGDEGLKWVRDEDRLFFRMKMRNVKSNMSPNLSEFQNLRRANLERGVKKKSW